MRSLTLAFVLSIWASTGHAQDGSGDYAYFLAADTDNGSSLVIPISKDRPEDIRHARLLVKRRIPRDSDQSRPSIRVILEPDGINRNYLKIGAPGWSWRVEFIEFVPTGAPRGWIIPPRWIEERPEHAASRDFIHLIRHEFVAELDFPTLSVNIEKGGEGVVLTWNDIGDYLYTVEGLDPATGTWTPAPGQDWPIQLNRWLSPDIGGDNRLYRVKAQVSIP